MSGAKSKPLQPKTRTGARVRRFNDKILIDVSINPTDKPDWYEEYDRIIRRCYSASGAGGILAPDWHKASAFREWWEANEVVDKDFVVTWTVVNTLDKPMEFSPATGMFFPEAVRKFFMPPVTRNTEFSWNGPLGVVRRWHMQNGFAARGWRNGQHTTVSYHDNPLDAHLAWVGYHAEQLALFVQQEERPEAKQVLQRRLDRLHDAIKTRKEIKFL